MYSRDTQAEWDPCSTQVHTKENWSCQANQLRRCRTRGNHIRTKVSCELSNDNFWWWWIRTNSIRVHGRCTTTRCQEQLPCHDIAEQHQRFGRLLYSIPNTEFCWRRRWRIHFRLHQYFGTDTKNVFSEIFRQHGVMDHLLPNARIRLVEALTVSMNQEQ